MSAALSTETVEPTPRPAGHRVRYPYLHGLRALGAFLIVVGHAYAGILPNEAGSQIPQWIASAVKFLESFARMRVDSFIILSGFCMMIPVMERGNGLDYPGGTRAFLRRRFRRIVPTYYMALVLTLAMYLVMWLANPLNEGMRQQFLQRLDPADLMAHLLLVHNWNTTWAFSLNPPVWTISTEWQIYFLFCLLFLPAWRIGGGMACLGAAFAVGMLIPKEFEALGAWYPLLFAGGMCASAYTSEKFQGDAVYRAVSKIPMGLVSLLFFLLVTMSYIRHQDWLFAGGWLKYDLLSLVCAGALLLHCRFQCRLPREKRSRFSILPLLESRAMVWMGEFSYSLYITHFVTLSLLGWMIRPLDPSPLMQLFCLWGLGVPASVAVGYAFYLKFERPFVGPPTSSVPPVPLTTEEAEPRIVDVPREKHT